MTSLVTVVGKPKANSRTLTVASAVADRIASMWPDTATYTADLALHGSGLLAPWALSAEAADIVQHTRTADVLVLATPTYKGAYTGLLKLLLDTLPAGSLSRTVVVPVILFAGPAHRHLADLQLAAVLTELGAVRPSPSVLVQESEIGDVERVVDDWLAANRDLIGAVRTSLDRIDNATGPRAEL